MISIVLATFLIDVAPAIDFSLRQFSLELLTATAWAIFLYLFPGLGMLAWLTRDAKLTLYEELGLAAGLSLSLYPILLLWFYFIDLPIGRMLAWVPSIIRLDR